MNLAPLADLRAPATPPPSPSDASGRSSQRFVMDVVVRAGTAERRLRAHGRHNTRRAGVSSLRMATGTLSARGSASAYAEMISTHDDRRT
jgi:hypothetical protein